MKPLLRHLVWEVPLAALVVVVTVALHKRGVRHALVIGHSIFICLVTAGILYEGRTNFRQIIRAFRRQPRFPCLWCGHELAGPEVTVCPKCGTSIPPNAQAHSTGGDQ